MYLSNRYSISKITVFSSHMLFSLRFISSNQFIILQSILITVLVFCAARDEVKISL